MADNPNPYASPSLVTESARTFPDHCEQLEVRESAFNRWVIGVAAIFMLLFAFIPLSAHQTGNTISLTLTIIFASFQFLGAGHLFCLLLTKQVYNSAGISTWIGWWKTSTLKWPEVRSWERPPGSLIIELRTFSGRKRKRTLNPYGSRETSNRIASLLTQMVGQPIG